MTREARHCRIQGRVQGVGFRYFVQQNARSGSVFGWVKNLRNGDVELHVEGESDEVEAFLRMIRSGPPMAQVVEFECSDVESQGYNDFKIER